MPYLAERQEAAALPGPCTTLKTCLRNSVQKTDPILIYTYYYEQTSRSGATGLFSFLLKGEPVSDVISKYCKSLRGN